MTTNTLKHISDLSVYKDFDPAGTNFPDTIINVQEALGSLSLDGIEGVPQATMTVVGKSRFATQEETDAGILDSVAISPATLESRLSRPEATETVLGLTQYATNEEAIEGILTNRSIVASALKAVLDHTFLTRVSTETENGVLKISTTPAAIAGIDDTSAMSPLKVKQAIINATDNLPTYGDATPQTSGLVRIATTAQAYEGTLRDGYAISPQTLNGMVSTETNKGIIKLGTQLEVNNNTAGVAVTPETLNGRFGGSARRGVVRLTNTQGNNQGDPDGGTALSWDAAVVPSNRAAVTQQLYLGSQTVDNAYLTRNTLDQYLPIGSIILAAFNWDATSALICNGRLLNKNTYPVLFARIGYTYGGSGNNFAIPDMRGLVARGFDAGRGFDPGRRFASYQPDAMQPITGEFCADVASTGAVGKFVSGAFYDNGWSGYPADGGNHNNPEVRRIAFNSARQVRTAAETRAKSLALNYVIIVR